MKIVCVIFLVIVATAYGKVFTKCSLAQELVRDGVSRSTVHHWVCMATAESSMNTATTHTNHDGSADHGIFQINDYWNCDPRNGKKTKNGCKHPCSDFENTNLRDDIACINTLLRWQGGFAKLSYGYRAKCQGIAASYLSGCTY